jgi:uncharacterized protein (TIGR02001 family)
MKKTLLACAIATAVMIPSFASADLSSTVGLVSDYTFNGVSQTNGDPALQVSLDYDAGAFYVGTWASNVDFGKNEETDIEWDFYAGKYFQLSEALSLDTGIAYYTYHGQNHETESAPGAGDAKTASDDFAYPEIYAKTGFASVLGQTELNLWYSWDYFGLGGGHTVAMIAQSYEVVEGHTLRLSVDQSESQDETKWQWDGTDSYVHYRLAYQTSYEGFDFEVAAEDTSMTDVKIAEARIVAGVSYTFGL